MGIQNFGPDHDLAIRITKLEDDVRALSTRDILQNASIGVNGLTVNGTGGINVTGGGSITISGSGILNVAAGGLNSAGTINAATTITAGGSISAGGALSGASLNVGAGAISAGSSAVSGAASVGGTSTLGPINSTYSRSHTVVSGYANAYWDGNGDGGVNVSSVIYKQDVTPADLSPEVKAILALALVRFRYISAVEEHGDAAPVEIGSIAEYLDTIGLGEWVFRDADGTVQGISYERLTIPLIAVVQSLDKRLKAGGL